MKNLITPQQAIDFMKDFKLHSKETKNNTVFLKYTNENIPNALIVSYSTHFNKHYQDLYYCGEKILRKKNDFSSSIIKQANDIIDAINAEIKYLENI